MSVVGACLAAMLMAGCGGDGYETSAYETSASDTVAVTGTAADNRQPTHSSTVSPSTGTTMPVEGSVGSTPGPAPTDPVDSSPMPVKQILVDSVAALHSAVAAANASGGNVSILLADGVYQLAGTINVNAPNIALASASGQPTAVTIQGDAMSADAKVKNLIRVTGKGFQLRGITLQRSGWHLVQIVGEADADDPVFRDCIFRDAWEQMLKVSWNANTPDVTADGGLVENCLFEYTAGIGPQWYIGGIDAHGSHNWIVRNNVFRNIASPSGHIAEHAIHFWTNSTDILVERNIIIDSDRGIGFGLGNRGNVRGVIRNNFIHHTANNHPFADVGIVLENSPGTLVYNNTIFMEHSYPRAIEYRFAGTTGVQILNNLTNRSISARDGGSGTVASNFTNATRAMFRLQSPGDLTLTGPHAGVVDAGQAIAGLVEDIAGEARPKGAGIDIGADEY